MASERTTAALGAHVVIAGGGAAGLAAAIRLRLQGLTVTLCDAASTTTTPLGERISTRSAPLLTSLQIEPAHVASRAELSAGIVSAWGSPVPRVADVSLNPYGAAWHLDRAAFDEMLRRQAATLGARLLPHTRVVAADSRDHGGWRVTIRNREGTTTCDAIAIVDATGRTCRNPLGVPRPKLVQDNLIATAFIFPAPLKEPYRCWTLIEACAHGWWYSAPLPDDRSSIVLFTDRDFIGRHIADIHRLTLSTAAHLTAERIPSSHLAPERRRVSAVVGVAVPTDISTCVPVGDAALALDPLSGSGIHVALETAIAAADAITAFHGGRSDRLRDYHDRVSASFTAHLETRARIYAEEGRWTDEPFWRRRALRLTEDRQRDSR